MDAVLQSGYKIKYKLWSDFRVYEMTIEGAVKYKLKQVDHAKEWAWWIRFYNKNKVIVFAIESRVEMLYIMQIHTTCLKYSKTKLLERIKNILHL